jgi:hypothetical protein
MSTHIFNTRHGPTYKYKWVHSINTSAYKFRWVNSLLIQYYNIKYRWVNWPSIPRHENSGEYTCTTLILVHYQQSRSLHSVRLSVWYRVNQSFLYFLAHLSWKLKWAILITRCPSSFCPSVRLSVNFYIFDFFSRTTGQILTKLGTTHPWGEGILNW